MATLEQRVTVLEHKLLINKKRYSIVVFKGCEEEVYTSRTEISGPGDDVYFELNLPQMHFGNMIRRNS
jgi:hypothetical protein